MERDARTVFMVLVMYRSGGPRREGYYEHNNKVVCFVEERWEPQHEVREELVSPTASK